MLLKITLKLKRGEHPGRPISEPGPNGYPLLYSLFINLLIFVFQSDILVPAKEELFLENGEEYIQLTQDHLGGIAPLYEHCRT